MLGRSNRYTVGEGIAMKNSVDINMRSMVLTEVKRLRAVTALILVMVLLLSSLSFSPLISRAAGATTSDVTFDVMQTFSFSGTVTPPNSSFTYQLTPDDPSYPMPASGSTFVIQGTESKSITLSFATTGQYFYELSNITSAATGYTLDSKVYTLEITIKGDLSSYLVAYDSKTGEKVAEITYSHSYKGSTTPTDPVPPSVNPGTNPSTGTNPVDPPAAVTTPDTPVEPATAGSNADITQVIPPLIGAADQPSWALANLILSVLGILLGLLVAIRALIRRLRTPKEDPIAQRNNAQTSQKAEYLVYTGHSGARQHMIRYPWLIVTFILAIAGFGFFFLVDDIELPMVLLNLWSILFAVILVFEIVASTRVFKKGEKPRRNDENLASEGTL